ncbi:MAG TPA: sigma factor, partial [Candidatus Dormibacteraeota bacterium]|nr:sigma factor [Candidatus Dormibacteraeota bacterium]
ESDGMGSQPVHSSGDDAVLRDVRKHARLNPPLDAAEERRLLELAARGDKASQERLVAAKLAMVVRLAEAHSDRGLSVPDLVQEGSIGLVDAVQSFSPSGAQDFDAFAEQKVGTQMDAAIAAEAAAVRDGELLVAAANDYERTDLLLRRELHRAATTAELAEKLEWTVERTQYVASVVADARRRHDEELLEFIDPDAIDFDGSVDGE